MSSIPDAPPSVKRRARVGRKTGAYLIPVAAVDAAKIAQVQFLYLGAVQ